MKDYKSMTAAQKAMTREKIVAKAKTLDPKARKTYIAGLKAKGISPSTIGFGTTKNSTYKESLLGKKKVQTKKKYVVFLHLYRRC